MQLARRDIVAGLMGVAVSTLGSAALPASAEEFKAAIVMSGSIADQSWNRIGYEAMQLAEEKLGIETAYSERMTKPDQLEALSDYARQGYDVVIGHGPELVDAVESAAERHPETLFAVTDGLVSAQNIASVTFNFEHVGYVLGFLGAKMSEAGQAAFITTQKTQMATELDDAFKEGFRSVHGAAGFVSIYIEGRTVEFNFESFRSTVGDPPGVADAKILAEHYVNDVYVDVIFPLLDDAHALRAVLQAAQAADAWSFGVWQDTFENWPDTVLQSVTMDFRIALVDFLELAKDGEAEGKIYKFGVGTGAGLFGAYNPAIPEDAVEETEDLIQKLKSGEIKI